MKIRRLSIIILCLCFFGAFASADTEETLIFSAMLIRHGDRTPYAEMPSSKFNYHWEAGIGELTPLGMHQEFTLGQAMRARYVERYKLLPPVYANNCVYALSTDFNRTITSALCFLAGLYPAGTGPKLDQEHPALPYAAQPVPVRTIPNGQKNFINPTSENIDKHAALVKKYALSQKAWQEANIKLAGDYKRWSEILGVKISSLEDTLIPGDHLYCMKVHHIPLPEGITPEDAQKLINTRHYAAVLRYVPKPMAYYMAAEFLAKLQSDFLLAQEGKQPYKLKLYSGHDDSLIGIMSALNDPLQENPPYASHLNFELFRRNGNLIVEVRFNGEPVHLLPGKTKDSYTLEEFMQLISPIINSQTQTDPPVPKPSGYYSPAGGLKSDTSYNSYDNALVPAYTEA